MSPIPIAVHLLALVHLLVLVLVLPRLATADFNEGSGVMLTVPPLGSVGPINGRVWGLPSPLSQFVAIVLDSSACAIFWDKGHNMNRGLGLNTAGIPIGDDGRFVLHSWDASPYDAVANRFAAFIVNRDFPLAWPDYTMENYIIHDYIFEGASSWTFIDRSSCTDPAAPCIGVTWVPRRPQPTPDAPRPGLPLNFCDRPPELPLGLPCPGCVDAPGAYPPATPIPRDQLVALSGTGPLPAVPPAVVVPPPPSESPSPTPAAAVVPPVDDAGSADGIAASPSPSASASPSASPAVVPPSPTPVVALRGSSGADALMGVVNNILAAAVAIAVVGGILRV
jgi:hypothetical protein